MGYLDKQCKGCALSQLMRDDCFTKPTYIHKNITYNCPCLNCLVKSMCSEICPDYLNFKTKYWSNLHNIIMNKHKTRRIPIYQTKIV